MGLHVTPHGTFYVQRSLQTGEVVQVLPVKRPDMPSQLPSVDSLGITENFIESRRASLAADTARTCDSQGRLQQELATAGGESLLATGKAALAQTGEASGSNNSNFGSHTRSSPSAQNYDGDIEMAYGSSTARLAGAPPTSPASYQHTHHSGSRQSRGGSRRGSNMNYILSEDPHQPPSSMAMASNMLPVRPWPDAHHESTVNLPPFSEIDSARALTHEEELRREEQTSSSRGNGARHKPTPSPRMTSLFRSSSSNSSRRNSTSSMNFGHNTNNSTTSSSNNTFSINNMISHGSEGSVSSAYSVSEASTPSVVSPGPEFYYCNSSNGYSPAATYAAVSPAIGSLGNGCGMMIDGASSPQIPPAASYRSSSNKNTPRASRVNKTCSSPSPRPSAASISSAPSVQIPPAASLAPSPLTAAPQKKNKTVWIIRTLEPRKTTSRRTNSGEDYDDYEPQRVQTHVETHIVP
ncbi:hypothetical protein SBRCBS47491_010231 [Sporothrix bragantina]|uniref:Uncharacterized protein n=1 Tax=Sporothrix bragantina TaxID=671064 RepID=A0ABP0D4D3_9PEZI